MTHKGCYAYFSTVDDHMGTKEFITGPPDTYIASLCISMPFAVQVWRCTRTHTTRVYSVFLVIFLQNSKHRTLYCMYVYVWTWFGNVVMKAGQVARNHMSVTVSLTKYMC